MSAQEARIRPATVHDLDRVAEIFAHYVTTGVATFEEQPPTREAWRSRLAELSEAGLPLLVADHDGLAVGYAYVSHWRPRPAYRHTVEDSVYLSPQWTGRGLGRRLLEALLAECARAGIRQVIAVIADTGDPASGALHRACGFREAGRLRAVGYKRGRWIDTLLMQRDLGVAPPADGP
ncbi:MAG TPA: GNAT family N-acetyltransferase [Candidatus Dormibacteraeota bacterium]|nr:GNAT family N-acetyltransferase [Candidatus Dormibacteraeota bacterium]